MNVKELTDAQLFFLVSSTERFNVPEWREQGLSEQFAKEATEIEIVLNKELRRRKLTYKNFLK